MKTRNPHSDPDDHSEPGTCSHVREQLGALAIGALDSFDRGIVEHHLRWCPSCRDEAEAYQATADSLAASVTFGPAPSPATWASIAKAIQIEPGSPVAAPSAPIAGHLMPSRSSGRPSWAYALLAPMAIALLVVSVWANALRSDLDQARADTDVMASMNAALFGRSDVQMTEVVQGCEHCLGNAQVGYSATDRMGVVIGWNFNPKQQHDVWQVNQLGDRKRVCQLHIDAAGGVMQLIQLPEAPSTYPDVLVTDVNGELIYSFHLIVPDEAEQVA